MEKELKELLKNVILNQIAINARMIHQKSNINGDSISITSVQKAIDDFKFVQNHKSDKLKQFLKNLDL